MTTNHRRRSATRVAAAVLFAGSVALLYLLRQPSPSVLDSIIDSGTLVVAAHRGSASFFDGADGPDGLDHALTRAFASELGVRVRYVFPDSVEGLLADVRAGRVHMAAAALTVTPERRRMLHFSTPYADVTEQLVYRRGSQRPRSLADVDPGDLHVVASSAEAETLRDLRDKQFPSLSWQLHTMDGVEPLLAGVDRGDYRLAVAGSHIATLSRRFYPRIAVAFDLGEARPVAWAFPRHTDASLRTAVDRFLGRIQADGQLGRLHARFFGHTGRLNFVDTREFWRQVRDRLPALRPHFEQAAEQTGFDWRLLAAIGYQESHWQADAVSPTGVRGIMMLTRATAQQVGVDNREDAAQSIRGGARYLRIVDRKIPQRIERPDRLWLMLAGYNIGFGHLEDARILTQREGADPDLWMDVKQRLPLLEDPAHHATVRHGYARGREAVDFVDNIRNFYDLLVWYTTSGDRATVARLMTDEPEG